MFKACKVVPLIMTMMFIWGTSLLAQAPDTLWTKTYGGWAGYSVQQTADKGYIVVGQTSWGASANVKLIRTDENGDTLWTKIHTSAGSYRDEGHSVQQTTDEGYIIAGRTTSGSGGGWDVYLIRTDENGDTLWTKTYGGSGNDNAYSVRQASDGGYIIVGNTKSFNWNYDVWLLKTDADGDTLWTKTYGENSDDHGNSVQQTDDKGYIIGGWSAAPTAKLYLIKTDSLGDTLWTGFYGNAGYHEGHSVQQTADKGYVAVGCEMVPGTGDAIYIVKTDSFGDTLWTKTYDFFSGAGEYDYGRSVQQTTDKGYIITGYSNNNQLELMKTDSLGNELWTWTIAGKGYSVQQIADRGYIITGTIRDSVCLIRMKPVLDHDVGPFSIDIDSLVPEGTTLSPMATVENLGTNTETFDVTCTIEPGAYTSTETVADLAPNDSIQVTFPDAFTFESGFYTVTVYTQLIGDENPANDTLDKVIETYDPGVAEDGSTPKAFMFNAPTISRGRTEIEFALPEATKVDLQVYDAIGRLCRTLMNKRKDAGVHTIIWDGKNNSGKKVPSGVYFLRFVTEKYSAVKKLLVMK